jgi:hypothetical protein
MCYMTSTPTFLSGTRLCSGFSRRLQQKSPSRLHFSLLYRLVSSFLIGVVNLVPFLPWYVALCGKCETLSRGGWHSWVHFSGLPRAMPVAAAAPASRSSLVMLLAGCCSMLRTSKLFHRIWFRGHDLISAGLGWHDRILKHKCVNTKKLFYVLKT